MEINKIVHQDCLEGLRAFPDNCIDCCVTDPPYGWKFMGKKWDYQIPGIPVWEEVLRVLKPGAHVLVACGTRTQHRMAVNIEDAGFEIRDVICWHYGSGFPKSLDISKAIDKANGKHDIDLRPFGSYIKEKRTATGLSLSGLDELMGTNTSASWWEGRKDGLQLPGKDMYAKLKEVLSLDGRFDELISWAEAKREVVGKHPNPASEIYKGGKLDRAIDITIAATDAAKQWDGWGTALKPATEFWTFARKPLSEKTIAQNVIKHGTGGLNIDACRIPFQSEDDKNSAIFGTGTSIIGGNYAGGNHTLSDRKNIEANNKGRFPANLILDDFMAEEMDRQSGILTSGARDGYRKARTPEHQSFHEKERNTGYSAPADSGGASRFFYVAKPSAEERGDTKHPTVKPQTLIQYLIKLICPIEAGRIILDPFAGSGSHCIAARKLGLDFIAYEKEEHSCKEANDRLQKEMGLFGQERPEDPDFCMNGGEY